MSTEDLSPRKALIKPGRLVLRRSVSETKIDSLFPFNLSLREAKSCNVSMEEIANKETSFTLEDLYKTEDPNDGEFFETKDMGANQMVTMKYDILNSQGRKHSLFEVAYKWKKDCRIWLWKNSDEFKRNRSVAEMNPTRF
ncbi:uncharacterized protein LOC126265283 [Aethina tumida]|uniref:uncharacterized protein LOC126265283 n=1 Tax=Aethina tumida TaxID=116153 RepID=UPI002148C2D3|nr:uncharacterized protein LOC126265283 [Aethina tumida]